MITDERLLHWLNAYFPMCVTLSGIVTEVSLSHLPNALVPIDVTLLGIVIAVRCGQQ